MPSRALVLIFVVVASIGGAQQPQTTTSPAQTQQQPASGSGDQSPAAKIVTQVDIVNVVFTVQDDHDRFVQGLSRDQFRVLDNNKPPKEVLDFSAQTGLPLRVGVLIDVSNSVRDRLQFEQQAAAEFLQQMIMPETDKAMVEAFDEIPEVLQDFTNDIDKLSTSLRKMSAGGSTAIWDAVFYACRDKLLKLQNTGPVRNVIILISDGNDTQSHAYRKEAIDMAQRADTTIYTISTGLGFSRSEGDNNLKDLADATGGRAFFPQALQDVETAFVHIQHELRSQYAITYKPDNFLSDGQFRTISIKALHGGLKVRSKRGYYTRKQ